MIKSSKSITNSKMVVTLFSTILVFLFLINFGSADLGTFKQGSCVDIVTPLNATSVNITQLKYPNSTNALSNVQMTKIGQAFNYTFCSNDVSGEYTYGYCDQDGNCYGNNYFINAVGQELTGAKASLYLVLLFISILIFVGLLFLGGILPYNNNKDEMTGYVIAVDNLKYAKILTYAFAYVALIAISYFLWIISYAYLDMEFLSDILRFIFYFLVICLFPGFILMMYIIIANWIRDSQVADAISRGLRITE